MNPTNFIILGPGRCGSNMLLYALRDHPDIYVYGEVLKRTSLKKEKISYADKHHEVFSHLYKARGCKLFFHHIPLKSKRWNWFANKARVIHLLREDPVRWYVSWIISRRNKFHVGFSESDLPSLESRKVTIDTKDMVRKIRDYHRKIEWSRKKFKSCLELSYEELVNDWETNIFNIQKFLNVDPMVLHPETIKINHETLQELVTNYDEVKQIYESTSKICPNN